MQIRAELCHVDTLRCIVRVEAWLDGSLQGSALGEAATAEEAEERALHRLYSRLGSIDEPQQLLNPARPEAQVDEPNLKQVPVERPRKIDQTPTSNAPLPPAIHQVPVTPAENAPSETPTDPDDWSDELTAIDMEIRRIGWSREQEQEYLTRAFGLGSRHKLTRYADLVAYLRQLKLIQANDDASTAPAPIRRGDLLQQGDEMLKQLGWSSDQARTFLQQQLGATSRQQLGDEQLLQFNMLLEEQTLKVS
ncbi:hypothetical protein Syncc8109_1364 [Synechococcus sp. WH 8109]|uniref:hypothetical protein n=1 Tax=Synechococcus sp. WH 8109 TaxID=166314 RepID=UPI0001B8DF21|nr:hypothetical protein [Synechococcus sp. WH 8109]AHF63727.1 hypothetical protein Syncc8109_1364 [Synechococcus sp. WH 8109]